VMNTVFI